MHAELHPGSHLRLMEVAALPELPGVPASSAGSSYMTAVRLRQTSNTTFSGRTACMHVSLERMQLLVADTQDC
jgi:hypothetical protein